MERRRRRRGEVTVVTATVALATALLMVQGVVGEATSNPLLRTSHFTLDQYSPSPPYHHGLFGFYGRRSNNDGSSDENDYQRRQQQQQHQLRQRQQQQKQQQQRQYLVNRKFEDDSIIYRSIDDRHNRRGSVALSISANDYPIRMKAHDKDSTGATISRDSSGMNVPQYDKERSKNLPGRKEFDENKGNNDYVVVPKEMEEMPFVADETFKDEGPGSVEIYKLDLFEEKKPQTGPMSNAKGVGSFWTGSTTTTTSVTMKTSNNKSKVPKKSSRLGWKVGKSSNGSFKSTMITTSTSGYEDANGSRSYNKDGKDLHGRSNFLDSELRSEASRKTSVEAFGVGGVPELQVGCEGLEAGGATPFSSPSSSPSSLKLKRSVENTDKVGEGKVYPLAPLNVVPISLNLDYDLSAESYEEMDELLKLKKLQEEPKRNKGNRGDMDATLMRDDYLIQDRNVKERLPVRGDLGNWSEPVVKSIKRDNDSKVRRERSSGTTSGYASSFKGPSRKLLWHDTDNGHERESGLWGYGEDEGVVSSDELDTEQRRRHRVEHGREKDEHNARGTVNAQIDKIREDYERSLEQQRRQQEEILRRFKEQERGRSTSRDFGREEEERSKLYEDRMEELRRREEARRQEDELRRRNLIPEDRRDFDNRRREWMEKKRLDEKEEEERRKQIEENRKRYEDMQRRRLESVPSNWIHPYNMTRYVSREEEERNRAAQRQRYDDERRRQMSEEERRRMEMERSRSRENVTRDGARKEQELQRRMEERRRKFEEERKLADYVRRNQPIEVRPDWQGRNESNVSQRWREGQEQRKAIEAVRQMNRSNRYPLGSGYERRQHGPFAPTYVDPRVSLDEARRRQEVEALQQRRQQEEEQRRRILEEERRREIDQRRAQSRRYEEERKRIEEIRLEEERRKQEAIEEQRRRSGFSVRVRPHPVTSAPASLIDRRETERAKEQQRIRQEQERQRQEIMARQNLRQQHENRAKTQWERENYRRVMTEQHKRQEEARLNALPVSASIIVRAEGSSSYPTFNPRGQFIFPDQPGKRIKVAQFPSISRKPTKGPNPCIWAVVQCCPTNANRLVNCFESLGCPGVNWNPNPCRADIEDAARDEVMRYYSSAQEEQNRQ